MFILDEGDWVAAKLLNWYSHGNPFPFGAQFTGARAGQCPEQLV
jgi:hypothetical protein